MAASELEARLLTPEPALRPPVRPAAVNALQPRAGIAVLRGARGRSLSPELLSPEDASRCRRLVAFFRPSLRMGVELRNVVPRLRRLLITFRAVQEFRQQRDVDPICDSQRTTLLPAANSGNPLSDSSVRCASRTRRPVYLQSDTRSGGSERRSAIAARGPGKRASSRKQPTAGGRSCPAAAWRNQAPSVRPATQPTAPWPPGSA